LTEKAIKVYAEPTSASPKKEKLGMLARAELKIKEQEEKKRLEAQEKIAI